MGHHETAGRAYTNHSSATLAGAEPGSPTHSGGIGNPGTGR